MVGPSSSHTAGAVKIGSISLKLLNEPIQEAYIWLHGSFLATGKGHGTDKALVAGLLGMKVDDSRVPESIEIAEENVVKVQIAGTDLGDVHPNTAKIELLGIHGKKIEVVASSIGGGRIAVNQINGHVVNFSGDYPTLVVYNEDRPGQVSEVTKMLALEEINIATMQLYRAKRGGNAVLIVECDQEVPKGIIDKMERQKGILKVTYLRGEEKHV